MQTEESIYHEVNHMRRTHGLRAFDGIEEFRNGFDVDAIMAKRGEIEAAQSKLDRYRGSGDEAERAHVATLERGIAALCRELLAIGGY